MKVLLLSPRPDVIKNIIERHGGIVDVSTGAPDTWPSPNDIDFIVSNGYRKILPASIIDKYNKLSIPMINIHISLLPWNRGADPNFWSWFDDTPKGVSIHYMTEKVDSGPIITQMEVSKWRGKETLRSSYEFLNFCADKLFELEWANIIAGRVDSYIPTMSGSYHAAGDKDKLMDHLPLGWDTPCDVITELGNAKKTLIA